MKLQSYYATCARLGKEPLQPTPDYPPADQPSGWWRLLTALLGLACLAFLCLIVGVGLYYPHGWMVLAIYAMGAFTLALGVHIVHQTRTTTPPPPHSYISESSHALHAHL